MVGRVGNDALAETALSLLRRDGVDVQGVMAEIGQSTGVALIAVSPEGENQIIVASGANALVDAGDVMGLPECDAILCQLEVPIVAVMAALDRAPNLFAVNLAPAITVPGRLLKKADLLIVNEGEAEFYGPALHTGNGMVAVTLGGAGAVLYHTGEEIARAPAFDVPVVDTTGAGDTFCGALVTALAEGQAPADALRFASAAGALAVTRPGAQPSLPSRQAVEALLKP
jgi:ribokinase